MDPTIKSWMDSSHCPLTQAVLVTFPMRFALEQGAGLYSTPLLRQFVAKVVSAENDPDWTARIATLFPDHEIRKPVAQCAQHKPPSCLSPEELQSIQEYYVRLDAEYAELSPRLLFVDGFECERIPMFNAIHTKYEMVILHDSEPQHTAAYGFDLIKTAYTRYHYGTGPVCGWAMPNTTLFTRDPMSTDQFDLLQVNIRNAIGPYCAQHGLDQSRFLHIMGRLG
jgi:hypothetical protein